MSETPQDVRDVLARLLHDRGCMAGAECRDSPTTWVTYYALADAVLAAVSPVIRQQEREAIAVALEKRLAERYPDDRRRSSDEWWARDTTLEIVEDLRAGRLPAAIAASHSIQPEEETNG